jgi:hypothetical protein
VLGREVARVPICTEVRLSSSFLRWQPCGATLYVGEADVRMCARAKPVLGRDEAQIIAGGILGGKTQPVGAGLGSSPLA